MSNYIWENYEQDDDDESGAVMDIFCFGPGPVK